MNRSLIVLLTVLALVQTARAHETSAGALQVVVRERDVQASVSLQVKDLDALLAVDADGDRLASEAEVRARAEAISDYVLSRIELKADGRLCPVDAAQSSLVGAAVHTRFTPRCRQPFRQLSVRYELFFEHDAAHRGFVRVSDAGQVFSGVITADRRDLEVQRAGANLGRSLLDHAREGIVHIFLGFDHVLFLLTLLLPAVLQRGARREVPVPSLRPALVEVLKVVSAFTLAHSLTLSLAALGLVQPNARAIETAIALSIVIAAVWNLFPGSRLQGFVLAFAFGLLHGFGFANALGTLQLGSSGIVAALLGFNLGVEAGQLCIVAAFFPLSFALRRRSWYPRVVVRSGSLLVAGVAALWLLERGLGIEIFSSLPGPGTRATLRHPLVLGGTGLLASALVFALAGRAGWRARPAWWTSPQLLWRIGLVATLSGVVVSAWQSQRAVASSLQAAEDHRRAAIRLQHEHRLDEAHAQLVAAGTLFERAADPASQADVLARLGDLELTRADPQRARARYLEVLQLRQEQHDLRGMAAACHALVVSAQVRGDTVEAASWLRRAIEHHEQLGLKRAVRRDMTQLAALYRETDQLAAAAELQRRAIVLDEELGLRRELAADLMKLAILEQLQGRLAEARTLYGRAIELEQALGNAAAVAKAMANDATVARLQGQLEDARGRYGLALTLFEQASDQESAARVRSLLAQLGR